MLDGLLSLLGMGGTGSGSPGGSISINGQTPMAGNSGFLPAKPGIDPMTGMPISATGGGFGIANVPNGSFISGGQTLNGLPWAQGLAAVNADAAAANHQGYQAPGTGGAMATSGPGAFQPYVSSSTVTNPASGASDSVIGSLLQNLLSGQQQQQTDYLKQYKNLMGSVAETSKNVNGSLNQLGQNGQDRINMNAQDQMGKATQSAYGRGLGNTTILDSLKSGVDFNKQMATNDLQSQIAGQKINAATNLGQMKGNAIQSLGQTNPMLNTYMSLISSLMGNASPGGLASAVGGTFGAGGGASKGRMTTSIGV